nr:MAG TPA: hypothetical protein [Caudoviricetes sp.]
MSIAKTVQSYREICRGLILFSQKEITPANHLARLLSTA